ncbi:tetratricopeptide repeat protein [Pseudomonas sp. JS3066]|uniref:tetratricopeptide repeat protein n=1 Tax=Pseudomonas sp. JS3066 TaxID=3090665 RepID=UPI002E7BA77E|nr:tetratricopeptide repeat protein [Pseudomonas sp. JS3066]WVK90969.1 tetratricopeptide repeat protein [Pseudomonas sp. JS3066]
MQAKPFLSILMLSLFAASALPAYSAERRLAQPSNGASAALLEAASLQLEFGELEQADDTLERALRIEPNNPTTLHYLGQVRFQQGQYAQAVALAMRSNARGRNDSELRERNFQLIESAQRAMGPGVSTGSDVEVERDEEAEVRVGLDQEVSAQQAAGIAAGGMAVPAEDGFLSDSQVGDWQSRGDGGLQAASYGDEDEMRIPRGHMPPPGQCRIWFPGRPAGQQPAPGKCKKLQGRIPRGAYLVRG